MRRTAMVGALVGVGVLVVWTRRAKLHERLMAQCEAMFERMPDGFPPKKMLRGIEEIGVRTTRILNLLEAQKENADKAVHHAA